MGKRGTPCTYAALLTPPSLPCLPPTPAPLSPLPACSRAFDERYSLGRKIGKGAMSTVHLGTDRQTGAR